MNAKILIGSLFLPVLLTACGGSDEAAEPAPKPSKTASKPVAAGVPSATEYYENLSKKCFLSGKALTAKLPANITTFKDILDLTSVAATAQRDLLRTIQTVAGPPAVKAEVQAKYITPATKAVDQALADVALLRKKVTPATADAQKAAVTRIMNEAPPSYDAFLTSKGLGNCTSTGE